MTTPPGQEPRPGARRGGPGRSRREADSGWADNGTGGPQFTPASTAGGGRPARDPDRGYGGRDGGDPRPARFTPGSARSRDRRDGPAEAPAFRPREGSQRGGQDRGGRDRGGRDRGGRDRGGRDRGGQDRGDRSNRGGRGERDADADVAANAVTGSAFEDPWTSKRGDRDGARGERADRGNPSKRDRAGRGERPDRGERADRGGRGDRGGRVPENPRSGPLLFRWMGRIPAAGSILIFFAAAIIGAVGTVVTHREPGFLLGLMIIVGSGIASLCIRRRSVYLLIPLPALTYLVLCFVTGYIHDRSMGTSTTALAGDFTQWLAGGFAGICVATILVMLIFGIRLLASRQLVSGQFSTSAQRPSSGRFPRAPMSPPSSPDRSPRGARAPWEDPDPWNDRGGRGESPRGESPRSESSRGESPRADRARGASSRGDSSRGESSRGDAKGDRRDRRDAWYEQPRSAGRGRPADDDQQQQRTQALPPSRQQPSGRGPNRDAPPERSSRRANDDRWNGDDRWSG